MSTPEPNIASKAERRCYLATCAVRTPQPAHTAMAIDPAMGSPYEERAEEEDCRRAADVTEMRWVAVAP